MMGRSAPKCESEKAPHRCEAKTLSRVKRGKLSIFEGTNDNCEWSIFFSKQNEIQLKCEEIILDLLVFLCEGSVEQF